MREAGDAHSVRLSCRRLSEASRAHVGRGTYMRCVMRRLARRDTGTEDWTMVVSSSARTAYLGVE